MRLLFVYPSWTGEYGLISHFARRAGVYPPLNLALLAAIAEDAGHDVKIIDGEADCLSMTQTIKQAMEFCPDLIALTGKSPFFHLSVRFAQGIKAINPFIPIVVGGQHITIMKEKAFEPCFDYGVVGECEDTFPVFLEKLPCSLVVSDVPGMLYRDPITKEAQYTGDHFYKRDLDNLPWPARHLLPYKKYRMGTMHGRLNFTSIQTVRGCPWKCIFCASDALKTTNIGKRSPKSVVAEMQYVIKTLGVRHFMIVDDVLTLDKPHIMEICDQILSQGLKITFEGSTRANLVTDEIVSKLKSAGLIRMSFGLETVDDEMRKTMNKKVPLEYYTKANEILDKYGIEALNSVMLGLPGETRQTIQKTLDFLKNDRHVKQANFAIAVPYPGTEFYNIAKAGEKGVKLLTEDFSQYRRYGNAVTNVNGLTQQDLIELQNDGFVSIYSAPWRWKPMLKKHGPIGGMLMLMRVFKLLIRKKIMEPFHANTIASPSCS